MKYIVQFHGIERDEITICRADVLPRKGEDVEIDDVCFTVIAVMHCATSEKTPPGGDHYATAGITTVRVI